MDCGVPVLPRGLPAGQPDPGLERPRLPRTAGARRSPSCTRPTTSPSSPGLICPAPCESACVLDINDDPVTIEQIELAIADARVRGGLDRARARRPSAPASTVGVVGSGPAGLAVAAELNKLGHKVTVYERDEAPGGLLRFGVPDAKLEKWIIDRRVALLEEEGIEFECGVDVGGDVDGGPSCARATTRSWWRSARACTATSTSRAASSSGVHFAMDYLYQRNRWVAREQGRPAPASPTERISAAGRARGRGRRRRHRHGLHLQRAARGRRGRADARRLPAAARRRAPGRARPWPLPPKRTPTTYALDEGGERRFGTQVTEIVGEDGRVTRRRAAAAWRARPRATCTPVPGSEFVRARRPRAGRDRLQPPRARGRGRASSGSTSTRAAT